MGAGVRTAAACIAAVAKDLTAGRRSRRRGGEEAVAAGAVARVRALRRAVAGAQTYAHWSRAVEGVPARTH